MASDLSFGTVASPFGALTWLAGSSGLAFLGFASPGEPRRADRIADRHRPLAAAVADAIARYGDGDATAFHGLELDLAAVRGEAHRRLLLTARTVRFGETITYGELAARAGLVRAARAAGSACAHNPIALAIPCHRVLPAAGGVGTYGGPHAQARRRALLLHEGVLAEA